MICLKSLVHWEWFRLFPLIVARMRGAEMRGIEGAPVWTTVSGDVAMTLFIGQSGPVNVAKPAARSNPEGIDYWSAAPHRRPPVTSVSGTTGATVGQLQTAREVTPGRPPIHTADTPRRRTLGSGRRKEAALFPPARPASGTTAGSSVGCHP